MKEHLIIIVAILGIGVSIFSAIVFRKNSSSKFLLSLFVLLITSTLFVMAIVANYSDVNHPVINFISLLFYVLLLLISPNMYLYVDHYLSGQTVSQTINNNIVHYFPAIALGLINMASFVLITKNAEDSIYTQIAADVLFYANSISLFFIFLLQNAFYIYLAIKKYHSNRQDLAELFSFTEDTPFKWIRAFIIGYILLIIGLYLQQVFSNQTWIFTMGVALYITYILYQGLRNPSFSELTQAAEQNELESPISESLPVLALENTLLTKDPMTTKEMKPIISEELQSQIWEDIQTLMQTKKAYRDQDLTVYTLAKLANTNSKYLRITIQKKYGKNFANYVNSFRVAEAQQLLLDPDQTHYNIEYIGEMAGFKSKSSFYSAFKVVTGVTPQAYRNEQA